METEFTLESRRKTPLPPLAAQSLAQSNHVDFLKNLYHQLRRQTPLSSLRAFARNLGLPAGRISEIVSGKRQMTAARAEQIAERLSMDPAERSRLIEGVLKAKRARVVRSCKSSPHACAIAGSSRRTHVLACESCAAARTT